MQVSVIGSQMGTYEFCGGSHERLSCGLFQGDHSSMEQVHYMGNSSRPPHHDPYYKTYSPAWRNHPNFGWGGNQIQTYSNTHNSYQSHPPYQLPPPPVHSQPSQKSTYSSSIENVLEKLTLPTTSFVQQTTSFMQEIRANFKNQREAIRNLESKKWQMVGEETTQSDEEVSDEDKKQEKAPAPSLQAPKVKEYKPKIPSPQRLQG
ncbi:hypothetical protein PIB30_066202 [Stylosanthes scabra]|uniref:Uncharacterized protein n=1 Tax=Stylosanthes scabra TaxID=79078 RepID=A0ABU6VKP4_9FABA|nr:hypothetical protein [Stylosanthes scabra]